MNKVDIVGLGALNMDSIYRVKSILEDGEAVVRDYTVFPGGSAANTIYGLAKLGVSAGFIGAVGNDSDGAALLKDFQEIGVDTSKIMVKKDIRTGSALCLSDEDCRRSIYILAGANSQLATADMDLDYINRAGWLHISSFADDGQLRVLRGLMEKLDASVQVSFSPGALYAARGLMVLKPFLARAGVLFLNQQEIKQLTGRTSAPELKPA